MAMAPALSRCCPVCQSNQAIKLCSFHFALFDDLDLSGDKTLLCCPACTMLYEEVAFSEEQLSHYYQINDHYSASAAGGTGSASEDNNRRYDRIIDQLDAGSGTLILDYGCGQGGLIARCLARGLRAAGIEKSARSRQMAEAAGLNVYESLDDFLARCPDHVGAVVFSHVLEHVLDPLTILRHAAERFGETLFFIEVPDAENYLKPEAIRWEEMYFEHINHFRKESLRRLAENIPLDIIREEQVSFSPDLNEVACLVLTGKVSPEKRPAQAASGPDGCLTPDLPIGPSDPELPQGPIAIWGISQYAMMLLGTCPDLSRRTVRLFDASTAKIGRTIGGLRVESPDGILSLDEQVTLLIPRSKYLEQMLALARQKFFRAPIMVI